MYVVLADNYDDAVVVGTFQDEGRAEEWAGRIREGYPQLAVSVAWAYSPRFRPELKEALDALVAGEVHA